MSLWATSSSRATSPLTPRSGSSARTTSTSGSSLTTGTTRSPSSAACTSPVNRRATCSRRSSSAVVSMSYLEQSTRYLGYDRRLANGLYRFYRDNDLLESRYGARYIGEMDRMFDTYRGTAARVHRLAGPEVPEDSRRHRLRLPPGDSGQGARRPAGPAPGELALQPRDLRLGPGLRGAAAAHARAPPARGPRLRPDDARRTREGDSVVPAPPRRPRARRRLDRVPGETRRARTRRVAERRRRRGRARRERAPGRPSTPRERTVSSRRLSSPTRRSPTTQAREARAGCSSDAERADLFATYVGERGNRRHRPGRAFERTDYRFEIVSDYGAFRDLQRHRLLTDRVAAPHR